MPGRRVRLGQVGHRAKRDGAAAEDTPAKRRRDPARRRGSRACERRPPARAARDADVDDLPGADDGAESGHALRRADRRGRAQPHRTRAGRAPREDPRHRARGAPARPGADRRVLSAPALRRPAPADHDRDGAGARAGASDRGRTDHRSRRHDPGADPQARRRAAGATRDRRALHHPRFRRRRGDRAPGRGAAPGRAGRARDARRRVAAAAARLHADAHRIGPGHDAARAPRGPRGAGDPGDPRAREDLRRRGMVPQARGGRRGSRRVARGAAGPDARHRRRVGIGQVDGRPLHRPPRRPERGRDPARRR